MSHNITGLHHVTAMTSDAQKNVDFYAGILGLRLVKKTINFDATDVYHLYYGDETGAPGTIMTFFPFPGIVKGRKGKGQLTVTAFSIPENAMAYWMKRLDKFRIPYEDPQERFDDEVFIYFEDYDGLGIELIANKTDTRKGFTYGQIPDEYAVKGFHGVSLTEEGYERTAGLLTGKMDHRLISEKGNRFRFSPSGKPGDFVDILCAPESMRGLGGSGTVHHLALLHPTIKCNWKSERLSSVMAWMSHRCWTVNTFIPSISVNREVSYLKLRPVTSVLRLMNLKPILVKH